MSLQSLAARGLWMSGLATVARRILTSGGSFVLTFHGVAGRRYFDLPRSVQPAFDGAGFDATLSWIADRFAFLTPQDLLERERPGVLLTFDDGFANQAATALPVLERWRAPAVLFVSTQHVEAPRDWLPATRDQVRSYWPRPDDVPEAIARDLFDGMSRQQLRFCAEHPLVTIGSHTVHHPFLTRCDDAELTTELERSKVLLEEWSSSCVDLFAYPTGDYDRRIALAVRAAGYRAAFAENPAGIGLPRYEIPRVDLYDSDPAYLAAKLSGLHRRPLAPGKILGPSAMSELGGDLRLVP